MENISPERFNELKQELEETKSKISEINRVDGFNPSLLVTCYSSETEERLYLQAEPAMLWFRLKYPHGKLEQATARLSDTMATVEGRVYDDDGNLLANAFVTRYRNDHDPYGKDYVQNAGTSAIRKALGNCGFGTPYGAQYIEGITERIDLNQTGVTAELPVDNGRITPKFTVPGTNAAKRIAPSQAEPAAPHVEAKMPNAEKSQTIEEQVPNAASAPAPVPAPKKRGRPRKVDDAPTTEKSEAPTGVAEFVGAVIETCKTAEGQPDDCNEHMPQSEASDDGSATPESGAAENADEAEFAAALAFTVPNGRYAGKTFKEILDSGEKSVIAYFLKPLYAGQPAQQAALCIAKHCPLN